MLLEVLAERSWLMFKSVSDSSTEGTEWMNTSAGSGGRQAGAELLLRPPHIWSSLGKGLPLPSVNLPRKYPYKPAQRPEPPLIASSKARIHVHACG